VRENAEAKAARLLVAGRLNVWWISDQEIRATCRGDSGVVYRVTFDPSGWSCTCPALSRCSHVLALQRVCLAPSPVRWQELPA
jgi:uncharacterized Zn finger protein